MLGSQALHQMDLGGHADDRARGGRFVGSDDGVGRAHPIGHLAYLPARLQLGEDDAAGVLGPEGLDLGAGEALCTEQWPPHSKKVAAFLSQAPQLTAVLSTAVGVAIVA